MAFSRLTGKRRWALIGVATVALAGVVYSFGPHQAVAQMMGHGMHMHQGGAGGHDMQNMPGLRGGDTLPEETAEMAAMFRDFPKLQREVTDLPNGIRTVTFSTDPDLMDIVVSHVTGMIDRVETGRDPQVFIQSPTLDILFDRRDRIVTEIEMTDAGIVVVQTSDDPEVVTALQVHAAEVSDMAARGMDAVHERMMGGAGN